MHPSSPLQLMTFLVLLCGVTLVAMGASGFNQLMERDIDALMIRTMQRPLPRGEMSLQAVAFLALCATGAGLALLSVPCQILPPFFALLSLLWYLIIYTPLKRKTNLALLLGALCGVFAPLIGWTMAGGAMADHRIVIFSGLLFIWQIPHFWLLQERHQKDYRRAGIRLVEFHTAAISRSSLFRIWLAALGAATLMLPVLGCIVNSPLSWFMLVLLMLSTVACLRSERLLFPAFSLFPLSLTAIVVLFRIVQGYV